MNIQAIAQTAHEVNRAYCMALGDTSLAPWPDAPEWQQQSGIKGVLFLRDNHNAGAVAAHHLWVSEKIGEGWTYGEKNDAHKKTHSCIVPFADLPKDQQAKYYLFVGTVRALLPLLEPEQGADYAMICLTDGKMPGTMKLDVKFNDSGEFNRASHAHQHINLLVQHMQAIAQPLDQETMQPLDPQTMQPLPVEPEGNVLTSINPTSKATH